MTQSNEARRGKPDGPRLLGIAWVALVVSQVAGVGPAEAGSQSTIAGSGQDVDVSCSSCPADVGSSGGNRAICGNGILETGEDCATCPADAAPEPVFTISPRLVAAGTAVTLSADPASILDSPEPSWDIGDGVHLPGFAVNHRYDTPGLYSVTLTSADLCGATRVSEPAGLYVVDRCGRDDPTPCCGDGRCEIGEQHFCTTDCPDAPPVDGFSVNVGAYGPVAVDEPVRFHATATTNPGETVVSYVWDFGDGFGAAGPSATHAFGAVGDYIVGVEVATDQDLTEEAKTVVNVHDAQVTASCASCVPTVRLTRDRARSLLFVEARLRMGEPPASELAGRYEVRGDLHVAGPLFEEHIGHVVPPRAVTSPGDTGDEYHLGYVVRAPLTGLWFAHVEWWAYPEDRGSGLPPVALGTAFAQASSKDGCTKECPVAWSANGRHERAASSQSDLARHSRDVVIGTVIEAHRCIRPEREITVVSGTSNESSGPAQIPQVYIVGRVLTIQVDEVVKRFGTIQEGDTVDVLAPGWVGIPLAGPGDQAMFFLAAGRPEYAAGTLVYPVAVPYEDRRERVPLRTATLRSVPARPDAIRLLDAMSQAERSALLDDVAASAAPLVRVLTPEGGSTVSGHGVLSVYAEDDLAVLGVQYRIEGADVGTEITEAPFELEWDWSTLDVPDGPHVLTAVARDAHDNYTESDPVPVTVANPPGDAPR